MQKLMQKYYPRSFLKLVLAGFALAVVPLILALAYNGYSIHKLAEYSQRTLYQAVQATQASRLLIEHVTVMQRSVRQFVIVGEPSVMQGYALAHERFESTAQRLHTFPLEDAQRDTLNTLIEAESGLYQQASQGTMLRDQAGEIVAAFAKLSQTARELDNQGNLLVDREVNTVQQMAGDTQQLIFWQMMALFPIAVILVVADQTADFPNRVRNPKARRR